MIAIAAQLFWVCKPVCAQVFTDAVVSEVASQALSLVLWIIFSLPWLILFTGQTSMLRLPLQWQINTRSSQINKTLTKWDKIKTSHDKFTGNMFPTIYNDFPSKSCNFYIRGSIPELLKPLQNMTYQYCTDKNVGFKQRQFWHIQHFIYCIRKILVTLQEVELRQGLTCDIWNKPQDLHFVL